MSRDIPPPSISLAGLTTRALRPTAVMAAAALVLGTAATAHAATGEQSTSAQLIALTQSYLNARAASVTERPADDRVLGSDAESVGEFTGQLRTDLLAEAPAAARFTEVNRRSAAEFDGASVRLLNPETRASSETASLSVTERTSLDYTDQGANAGRSATYQVGHKVTFAKVDGAWKISDDALALPKGSIEPLPYFTPSGPTRTPAAAPRLLPNAIPSYYASGSVLTKPHATAKPDGAAPYNRTAAVDYALRWAYGRNTEYPSFGNDCANFVSQSLYTGGWTIDGYPTNGKDEWWRYDAGGGILNLSTSWTVSQSLADYGFGPSNRFRSYGGETPSLGDVVFADWQTGASTFGADGHLDHSMIITGLTDPTSWDGILMTYHTTDTSNLALSAVALKEMQQLHGTDVTKEVFYFADPSGR